MYFFTFASVLMHVPINLYFCVKNPSALVTIKFIKGKPLVVIKAVLPPEEAPSSTGREFMEITNFFPCYL